MNKRQMQKFYFTTLTYVCAVVDKPGEEMTLHSQMKYGYNIATTTLMDEVAFYSYLEHCLDYFGYFLDIWFESETYKGNRMSFIYQGIPFYL